MSVMPAHQVDIAALAARVLTLYSLAEFQSGHATTIRVHAQRTSFGVSDDGRGHAVERVIGGVPYLRLIYTHLAYPCGAPHAPAVQLQGIGMSLLNGLCSELSVVARKPDTTFHMLFADGVLQHEETVATTASTTGNTITGTVSPLLQRESSDLPGLESWLLAVLRSVPTLKLHFNDRELHVSSAG